MDVSFPRLSTIGYHEAVIETCQRTSREPGDVCFDLSRVEWIDPFALTFLTATILSRIKRKKSSRYIAPNTVQVRRFLERIGFNDFFQLRHTMTTRFGTCVELRQLRNLNPTYMENLLSILRRQVHISDALAHSILLSLNEIFLNVFSHSQSSIGGIACAQYYRTSERIKICITDFGVGIRETLKQRYPELKTDQQAIVRAVQEGVSGKGDRRGVGLKLIRDFLRANDGRLTIISGRAKVDFYRTNITRRVPGYNLHGTSVFLDINASGDALYVLSSEGIL